MVRNYFSRRGLTTTSSSPVQLSSYVFDADQVLEFDDGQGRDQVSPSLGLGSDLPDGDQDLIDLHPTANDVDIEAEEDPIMDVAMDEDSPAQSTAESDFDILEEVQRFEDKGVYPS